MASQTYREICDQEMARQRRKQRARQDAIRYVNVDYIQGRATTKEAEQVRRAKEFLGVAQ